MKESPYITWAKTHHDLRYSLAGSGVRPCPRELLEPPLEPFPLSGPNEEGWLPLLERIAARYRLGPENVVLAHGASMANHLVCAQIIEHGDDVLVERPVYEPLYLLPRFYRANVAFFERRVADSFALDIDEIRRRLTPRTTLLVCSNLHNPTGVLTERATLEKLGELADHEDFHVLVDEVYLEWMLDQGETSAAALGPRFIVTSSLTKAYGLDDLRAGWIVAEPRIVEKLRRLNDLFSIKMVHLAERWAAQALDCAPALLEALRPVLEANRELVDSFIGAHPALEWLPPPGGTVGWVRLRGLEVEELNTRLLPLETAVAPGRFFCAPEFFRIGLGQATELLEEGLERLARGLAS
ncbi:MAG: pyridoxal phosphate-dependent aminotransferase [Thermoanaerobaculia bacterium]